MRGGEDGYADVTRGLEDQRLFLGQLQDRVAHRCDAGAQLFGQVADAQAVIGLETPGDQCLAQQLVDATAQVRVIEGLNRVGVAH